MSLKATRQGSTVKADVRHTQKYTLPDQKGNVRTFFINTLTLLVFMSFEENIKNTRNMEGIGVWRYLLRVEARRNSRFWNTEIKPKQTKNHSFLLQKVYWE